MLKRNVLDRLIHEAGGDFTRLETRARAELNLLDLSELDPAQGVLLFADHGFRLAEDGRGYRHGGASTLERLVPVLSLKPFR